MARRRKGQPINGWVVLDKAYGLGSTKAVGRVRWLYQAQKAGHAGTLDPLATGVLPIALGEATKTVSHMVDAAKGYDFALKFGADTTSWDAEGEVSATSDHRPSAADIRAALPGFIGDIDQRPPRFSAIKVDGKRSYDLARAGEGVDLPARRVRVDGIRLTGYDGQVAHVSVECGKGTYIRSIARDLAHALGTCGHVTALRRTRVGPFGLDVATSVDALESMDYSRRIAALLPIDRSLDDIPVIEISDAVAIRQGRKLATSEPDTDTVLLRHHGKPLALATIVAGEIRPKRVFNLEVPDGG